MGALAGGADLVDDVPSRLSLTISNAPIRGRKRDEHARLIQKISDLSVGIPVFGSFGNWLFGNYYSVEPQRVQEFPKWNRDGRLRDLGVANEDGWLPTNHDGSVGCEQEGSEAGSGSP